MYVEVSIPIALFKSFTYKIPKKYQNKIFLGQSVTIPFKNKKINGFIIEIKNNSDYDGKLLNVISVNENSFQINPELWKTLIWISKYYICPLGQTLGNTISYQHKNKFKIPSEKYVQLTNHGLKNIKKINYPIQKKILQLLYKSPNYKANLSLFKKELPSYHQACKTLESKRLISIKKINKIDSLMSKKIQYKSLILKKYQSLVLKDIQSDLNNDNKKPILLSGIPGSGKTMIYIKIIEDFLKKNLNILILVPEVSQIFHVYNSLANYVKEDIGLWHSKLSTSEKNYVLSGIKSNTIRIVVGTRSSLFTPFSNLGLIIVDEEQELNYKQDLSSPYYNARDVALMRSKFSKCSILLVSSAPSLETYHNIKLKKYYNHSLSRKYFENQETNIRLIDMSSQKGFLSDVLIHKIEETITNKQQIILLHNKRGYDKGGIQKVESILYKFFPSIKILRYDGDTIVGSKAYYSILNNFEQGNADILLGTSIISKGLDFSNVSLVAMINADFGLSSPDFRSGERIFQNIYQLVGRAGRRDAKSTAIIQTNNVDDEYIKNACKNNLEENYTQILRDRKDLDYPPYTRLIKILFLSKNDMNAEKQSSSFIKNFKSNLNIQVLGPVKIKNNVDEILNRYQILIKCKKHYWQKFHDLITENLKNSNTDLKKQKIKIDVDPISFF